MWFPQMSCISFRRIISLSKVLRLISCEGDITLPKRDTPHPRQTCLFRKSYVSSHPGRHDSSERDTLHPREPRLIRQRHVSSESVTSNLNRERNVSSKRATSHLIRGETWLWRRHAFLAFFIFLPSHFHRHYQRARRIFLAVEKIKLLKTKIGKLRIVLFCSIND